MYKRKTGLTALLIMGLLLSLLLPAVLTGCGQGVGVIGGADGPTQVLVSDNAENAPGADLPVYGEYYYDVENVVLYLTLYDELPDNYITKSEARELGWRGGSVEDVLPGAAIGGDRFGNREGLLPEAAGRSYTECDIDTDGYGSRGARRLVYSSDGLYFYSTDHYESFAEVTVTEDWEVIW